MRKLKRETQRRKIYRKKKGKFTTTIERKADRVGGQSTGGFAVEGVLSENKSFDSLPNRGGGYKSRGCKIKGSVVKKEIGKQGSVKKTDKQKELDYTEKKTRSQRGGSKNDLGLGKRLGGHQLGRDARSCTGFGGGSKLKRKAEGKKHVSRGQH